MCIKVANVHGVLLDEALVLLTKKRDKLLLKFHGAMYSNDPRTGELKVLRYCPIVVLSAVEVKDDPNGNFDDTFCVPKNCCLSLPKCKRQQLFTDELRFYIQETNSHVPPYELSARSNGEKILYEFY